MTVDERTRRAAHEAASSIATLHRRADPRYPECLARRLDAAPPDVLFAQGDLAALADVRVAIVGTRRCTGPARGSPASSVVSSPTRGSRWSPGLALGIDGAAHRGVLDAGGRPVGVVGSGLDVVYPAKHRDLWERVARRPALLLSEAPLGSRPEAWRFPARNRIIAALSHLVVVVESHAAGGSMLTVKEAADRDIPVMAVPGLGPQPVVGGHEPPDRRRVCSGPRHHRRDRRARSHRRGRAPSADPRPPPDPRQKVVLDAFDWEPATLEHLAVRTGMRLPDLALTLEALLAAGWVVRRRRLVRAGQPVSDRSRSVAAPRRYGGSMAWHDAEFLGSLSSVAPRTVEAYRRDLAGFAEWAERGGVHGPEAVDRTLLRRYVAHLATRRYAKRSIARKVSALRRYFRWATRRGLVAADPSSSLSAPRGDGRLPRVLKQDELTALLDEPSARAGDDPVRRARDDAVLELLYGSGVRVGELCALSVGDIDLARGRAIVWGKGGKQRAVPLSEPAVHALRQWIGPRARRVARRRRAPPTRCSSTSGAAPSRPATCAASSTAGPPRPPTRTPCATPSPRTCSTVAPTCVPCRSCSVTPTWPPPSVTLTSVGSGCAPCTTPPTRGPGMTGTGMSPR